LNVNEEQSLRLNQTIASKKFVDLSANSSRLEEPLDPQKEAKRRAILKSLKKAHEASQLK